MLDSQPGTDRLLETLAGDSCEYCETGTLERGTYKGNQAVICASCGVPGVQVW
ncbi:HVO_A0556 family zinc finger protein [Natronococcus roseus]|uniref:HVO_A0556 family zinc finger protein n=1 Tax=Natronococcus roseus TaxID=1052014 RepID=UPI00374D9FD3